MGLGPLKKGCLISFSLIITMVSLPGAVDVASVFDVVAETAFLALGILWPCDAVAGKLGLDLRNSMPPCTNGIKLGVWGQVEHCGVAGHHSVAGVAGA